MKAEDVVAQLEAAAHRKRVEAEALDEAASKISVALRVEEELKERRTQRKPRQRKAAASRPRTPTERSKASVMKVLGEADGAMTVDQLVKETGLTKSAVRRGVSSIDNDLLEVVRGSRTSPAHYSLKSMREEVSA